MENWIEKIKEFIRKAMNEGLSIYTYKCEEHYDIRIMRDNSLYKTFNIIIYKNYITISSPNSGFVKIENILSKRDELELDATILSIEEYKEDMAISEFNNFFNKDNTPTTINDLDNEDD